MRTTNPQRPRYAALIEALDKDHPTQEAFNALWLAASLFVATGGAVPLERFLGLPTGPKSLPIVLRNMSLRKAAALLEETRPWVCAMRLQSELEVFASRGGWQQWRHLQAPPADASELRKALFFVMKHGNGKIPTARQLLRVIEES